MTYQADEESVEDGRPQEGFEFILPTVTYRLTSGVKDVSIGGQTYRATTIERGAIDIKTDGDAADLEVPVLITHALPQRYLQLGVPPKRIDVNVYRKQLNSGDSVSVWTGRVVGMRCEKHVATFLIAQRLGDAAPRRIPTITVGRECPHVLYDTPCGVLRNSFKVSTTVTAVDGAAVVVDSMGANPDQWAQWGELVHVASAERMTIADQTGTTIRMQVPIVGMQEGDEVEVYAGCDHTIATCLEKFANQNRFGGFPQLPKRNPFVSNGYGIYESE